MHWDLRRGFDRDQVCQKPAAGQFSNPFDLPQTAARLADLFKEAPKEAAMKAQDVMTRNVVSISSDDTVTHAIQIMLQKRISGLPVIDAAGRLAGIVTEGDFLRRAETATQRKRPRWLEFVLGPGHLADEYVRTHGRKVSEVMTSEPVTVTEDTPLEDLVTLMEKRHIKRVPVVRGDKVVGLVSRANLLRALASVSAEVKPAAGDDNTIRDRILAEFKKEKWAPVVSIDVTVRDGNVGLWGTISDERERQALIVVAENVPGVKKVTDHLAWIEPMSGMVMLPQDEEIPKAS
jgi:CBS domain-containing protein